MSPARDSHSFLGIVRCVGGPLAVVLVSISPCLVLTETEMRMRFPPALVASVSVSSKARFQPTYFQRISLVSPLYMPTSGDLPPLASIPYARTTPTSDLTRPRIQRKLPPPPLRIPYLLLSDPRPLFFFPARLLQEDLIVRPSRRR
jgi:hypothetical protein